MTSPATKPFNSTSPRPSTPALSGRRSRAAEAVRYPSTSRRPTAWSDRNQVVVVDRADVAGIQRQQRRSPTGCSHELHLEPVGLVDFHDRAKIPLAQPVVR